MDVKTMTGSLQLIFHGRENNMEELAFCGKPSGKSDYDKKYRACGICGTSNRNTVLT
jgi:hypothetical protein